MEILRKRVDSVCVREVGKDARFGGRLNEISWEGVGKEALKGEVKK